MDLHIWYGRAKKIILGAFAVTPLIFSPVLSIDTEFIKLCWFIGVVCLALILSVLKIITTRSVTLLNSPAVLGWSVLAITSFLSLLISSGNKIEALLSPVGAITLLVGFCLLVFFIPLLTKKDVRFFTHSFLVSVVIVAIVSLYQHLGVAKMMFPQAFFANDPLWNTVGSPVTMLWLFGFTLPFFVRMGLRGKHAGNETPVALAGVAIILTLVAGVFTSVRLIPNISSYILPIGTGIHAVSSLFSSPVRGLFGVGAENFFPLFTSIRPAAFNSMPFWTVGFHQNSTLLLHIGSISGIMGLLGFIFLIITTVRSIPQSRFFAVWVSVLILLLLIAPPSITVFISLLTMAIMMENHEKNQTHSYSDPVIRYPLLVILPLTVALLLYGIGRAFGGEYYFAQSHEEGQAGNGSATFISQQRAIDANPFMSLYHVGLAKTSTALASALIKSADIDANGNPKLTNDDQTVVKQMVSEAIRQSKFAVTLAPDNVVTWTTLAQTYQQLVTAAADADTWAIASYQKAISLDPTNPVLARDFGMLYTNLGRYDEAHESFVTAVQLKPDYANAFYTMAHMFIKKGDSVNAKKALEETLALVKNDENASEKILQELKSLQAGTTPQAEPTPDISDNRPPLIP